jgi:GDPmannose 4,6-dehydratase
VKRALITGITGQDGSYLSELLLNKGYEVHGLVRKESYANKDKLKNIKHIKENLILHQGEVSNYATIYKLFSRIEFNECYHLSGVSFVDYSLESTRLIMDANFNSTSCLLDVITKVSKKCKIFYAGSSEMFGNPSVTPQTEETPFNPKTIYGISKVTSYYLLKQYREKENIFTCTGIIYNHESPRRGGEFVTKKIITSAIKIKKGLQKELYLGNIDAQRDWGYAPDYVEAMWKIMQQKAPDDFIISTGKLHSVREFTQMVFLYLDMNYLDYVKIDSKFFREGENNALCGDSSKIKKAFGWFAATSLSDTIKSMIESELHSFEC